MPTLTPIVVALEVLPAPSVGCMKTFADRPAAVGGAGALSPGRSGRAGAIEGPPMGAWGSTQLMGGCHTQDTTMGEVLLTSQPLQWPLP